MADIFRSSRANRQESWSPQKPRSLQDAWPDSVSPVIDPQEEKEARDNQQQGAGQRPEQISVGSRRPVGNAKPSQAPPAVVCPDRGRLAAGRISPTISGYAVNRCANAGAGQRPGWGTGPGESAPCMARNPASSLRRDWPAPGCLDRGRGYFFVLLAIFPAIAALVSVYGLFADPNTI